MSTAWVIVFSIVIGLAVGIWAMVLLTALGYHIL